MREACLRFAVILGVAVLAVTEILSSAGLIRWWPLALVWSALFLACPLWKLRRPQLPNIGAMDGALILSILSIAAITGWIAWLSPPNSADAMAYHLPRVVYWAQQGSVRFFPAAYLNQIMLQPLAEYFVLQTYVLSGGDRLANFVQWFGSIGSIVAVSLIAREFGAAGRGQICAALFCATLPNGILQSSGAKNDYLLALWLVAAAYFGMRFVADGERRDAIYLGLAAGLALLTKATAYLFIPAILLGILALAPRKRIVVAAGSCAMFVLLLNAPQYARNIDLSGSPLGYDSAQGNGFFRWRNEHFGWRATASNLMRNVSEQLGTPNSRWNQAVYDAVLRAHAWIGADVNDPATTWPWEKFNAPRNTNHEADANNRWHLLILIAACFTLNKRQATYAAGIVLAFVFFCFYLKWQPYLSRMFLPLFVVASPLAGVQIEKMRPRIIGLVICLFLLNNSRPYLFENWVRPLKGPASLLKTARRDNYFSDMKQWDEKADYIEAAGILQRGACRFVGIDSNEFQIEYPLMALLPGYRFVHVNVKNDSRKYAQGGELPCAIVCFNCVGKATGYKGKLTETRHFQVFE